jgi:hypothetical protein
MRVTSRVSPKHLTLNPKLHRRDGADDARHVWCPPSSGSSSPVRACVRACGSRPRARYLVAPKIPGVGEKLLGGGSTPCRGRRIRRTSTVVRGSDGAQRLAKTPGGQARQTGASASQTDEHAHSRDAYRAGFNTALADSAAHAAHGGALAPCRAHGRTSWVAEHIGYLAGVLTFNTEEIVPLGEAAQAPAARARLPGAEGPVHRCFSP